MIRLHRPVEPPVLGPMSDCASHRGAGTIGVMRVRTFALAAVAAAVLAAAPSALADDDDEVRVRGTCTGSAKSELRLRGDGDRIRVEFSAEAARGATWTVILLHERRIVVRATVRANRRVDFRRTVPDFFGSDEVAVRATASSGESCRAVATL